MSIVNCQIKSHIKFSGHTETLYVTLSINFVCVHTYHQQSFTKCYLLFHSHPPADKVTSDIKVPLYPARDLPYELQIKAFVGQKTRFV